MLSGCLVTLTDKGQSQDRNPGFLIFPDLCSFQVITEPAMFAHPVTQGKGLCLSRPEVSLT